MKVPAVVAGAVPLHRRGAEARAGQIADAPGVAEIVLRTGADLRREIVVIHPHLLVTFAPPAVQRVVDGHGHAHEMPMSCRLEERVVEGHRVGLVPPAGIEIGRVVRPLEPAAPIGSRIRRSAGASRKLFSESRADLRKGIGKILVGPAVRGIRRRRKPYSAVSQSNPKNGPRGVRICGQRASSHSAEARACARHNVGPSGPRARIARITPVARNAHSTVVWPGARVMVFARVSWPGSFGLGSRPGCDHASPPRPTRPVPGCSRAGGSLARAGVWGKGRS